MTEVLEDLREVLNYGDEDGGNEWEAIMKE
jgi:hypothetical protein